MLIPNMLDQFGDTFSVSLGFECEALGHEELFDIFVVGDDTIVNNNKLIVLA